MLKSSLNSLPHLTAECAAVDGRVHWLCADDSVDRTNNAEHKSAILCFPAVSCPGLVYFAPHF